MEAWAVDTLCKLCADMCHRVQVEESIEPVFERRERQERREQLCTCHQAKNIADTNQDLMAIGAFAQG
jgi:hypothetical protein